MRLAHSREATRSLPRAVLGRMVSTSERATPMCRWTLTRSLPKGVPGRMVSTSERAIQAGRQPITSATRPSTARGSERVGRALRPARALALCSVVALALAVPVEARDNTSNARLAKIVEANVIATHAYQVLLAKQAPKADSACYAAGVRSDDDLKALVAHQQGLLTADAAAARAWARGAKSAFDPAKDLDPILASGLAVPDGAPVNVFARYLKAHTKATDLKIRTIASLYQTVMEVERDGDLLQQQYALYIALGLPVYIGQLGLAGSD